jgi:hypothetical protein
VTTGLIAPAGDLDVLFKARTSAKIADVGFRSNGGVDISNRFEPRGSSTARANTNFKQGANDLSSLFMDIASSPITLTSVTIESFGVAPANATSGYTLESDGDIIRGINASNVDIGDWIVPKASAPGTYEVRATLSSGLTPVGTLNTWQALTSNRFWSLVRSTLGTSTSVLLIEIRQGSTTLGSCTVTMIATKEP